MKIQICIECEIEVSTTELVNSVCSVCREIEEDWPTTGFLETEEMEND